MSEAETFLGNIIGAIREEDAREYARLKSQGDNQELVEALRELLDTGINGGNNVRLAFIAASQKELSGEDLLRAEKSEIAVQKCRSLIAKHSK